MADLQQTVYLHSTSTKRLHHRQEHLQVVKDAVATSALLSWRSALVDRHLHWEMRKSQPAGEANKKCCDVFAERPHRDLRS